MIATDSYASAVALDSADGAFDGRFYGAEIGVIEQDPPALSATPPPIRVAAPTLPPQAPINYQLSAIQEASYPSFASSFMSSAAPLPAMTSIPTYTSAPAYTTSQAYAVTPSYPVLPSYPAVASYSMAPATSAYPALPSYCNQWCTGSVVGNCCQVVAMPACPACPPQIQYIKKPPQVQYVKSPPEVQYVKRELPAGPPRPLQENAAMVQRIKELESQIMSIRSKIQMKQEVHSQTTVQETYKVKTFEMAAKLAVMDGTDDGLYNGLPIEVEGEGLYRELVKAGRRPKPNTSLTGRASSITRSSETYKVATYELAEKLSKMDGTDDGKYNGLPIEIAGEGLYSELVRSGRRPRASR